MRQELHQILCTCDKCKRTEIIYTKLFGHKPLPKDWSEWYGKKNSPFFTMDLCNECLKKMIKLDKKMRLQKKKRIQKLNK